MDSLNQRLAFHWYARLAQFVVLDSRKFYIYTYMEVYNMFVFLHTKGKPPCIKVGVITNGPYGQVQAKPNLHLQNQKRHENLWKPMKTNSPWSAWARSNQKPTGPRKWTGNGWTWMKMGCLKIAQRRSTTVFVAMLRFHPVPATSYGMYGVVSKRKPSTLNSSELVVSSHW